MGTKVLDQGSATKNLRDKVRDMMVFVPEQFSAQTIRPCHLFKYTTLVIWRIWRGVGSVTMVFMVFFMLNQVAVVIRIVVLMVVVMVVVVVWGVDGPRCLRRGHSAGAFRRRLRQPPRRLQL
jgi:hypothetical protein